MAIYVPKFNGYIADVANLDFIRSDGTAFSFQEATATSANQTNDNMTITGGWSVYPLAYIDTGRNFEVSFTSAQFTMEMFELANNGTTETKDYGIYESDTFDVGTGLVITLPFEAQATTVKIRGLENSTETTPTAGHFKVTNVPAAEGTTATTTITFATGDVVVGDSVRVLYKRRIKNAEVLSVRTDSTTARGQATIHWPVYSSGDDTDNSTIKGYVHIDIPRVRVTALPGFDTSYKSASTNAITIAAINAKRSDKKAYDIIYEELDENGNFVVSYEGTMTW